MSSSSSSGDDTQIHVVLDVQPGPDGRERVFSLLYDGSTGDPRSQLARGTPKRSSDAVYTTLYAALIALYADRSGGAAAAADPESTLTLYTANAVAWRILCADETRNDRRYTALLTRIRNCTAQRAGPVYFARL